MIKHDQWAKYPYINSMVAPDRSWRDNPRAGENGSRTQYIELSGKACKFKLTRLAQDVNFGQ